LNKKMTACPPSDKTSSTVQPGTAMTVKKMEPLVPPTALFILQKGDIFSLQKKGTF